MESFYRTHHYLLEHLPDNLVRRGLMDEIDWSARLIGVKGTRGVGKTTFLLAAAKEFFGVDNRKCLYVNLNHFSFTKRTLTEFAAAFREQGGRTLLIDQVFKYPLWSKELRECYDLYPDLQFVFTGPAVMRLKEENPDLKGKVAVYYLRGFSFREYLNLTCGTAFKPFKLATVLENHCELALEIAAAVGSRLPQAFRDYLHHGFYPFFLEKRNYSENLLKVMNVTLEVDVLYIRQIEQRYLHRLRKLLYLLSLEAPAAPNVSRLSVELEMSRATVMNYIKYLRDARLVNLLYREGEDFPRKPSLAYIYNTNLLYAVNMEPVKPLTEYKTFFFNQLQKDSAVSAGVGQADFLIEGKYNFCIRATDAFRRTSACLYAAPCLAANAATATHVASPASPVQSPAQAAPSASPARFASPAPNVIPLWLFGFLY